MSPTTIALIASLAVAFVVWRIVRRWIRAISLLVLAAGLAGGGTFLGLGTPLHSTGPTPADSTPSIARQLHSLIDKIPDQSPTPTTIPSLPQDNQR